MRLSFYILIFILLSLGNAFAQDHSVVADSLHHEWQTNPNDTLKIFSLFRLINHELDEQNISRAYQLTLKARDFALEKNFNYSQAYSYEYLGHISHLNSNYDSALYYDLLTLKKFTELNDSIGIALSLNSIGEDYFDRELYSQAYNYYYRALKQGELINDSLTIAIATYNIGRVLKEQGYYERALTFIDSSLSISKKIGDEEGLAYSYYDVGEIYLELGKIDEARKKLESALEISQTLQSYLLIPQVYNKLGNLYQISGNNEEAIKNYEEALTYNKRLNNKSGIGESYFGLGVVYSSTGDHYRAEEYFKECLSLANEVKSSDLKSRCYFEISKLFESKGQIAKAFEYYKKYKTVLDTLFTSKKSEQLSQLQIEHVAQQRDLEIDLLNQKEAQHNAQIAQEELIRNVLVVLIAFFMVLLITLFRSSRRRRKMNNLLLIQQQELEQQRYELIELNKVKDKFFSIISHDLRSPINNLKGMSALLAGGNLKLDETTVISRSIEKQLKHASKLLDNLMDWVLLQSNEIKLKKENVGLRILVDENIEYLEEINDKNIKLKNETEDIQVFADKNMLELIIRNLLSNALKFTDKNGEIVVRSTLKDDKVVVSVSDNGIGVPAKIKTSLFEFNSTYTRQGTANEKGTGLGLKLCKEFIERNGGEIWVESEEGKGSTFNFTLQKAA
ncbi:MAG: tetratricopeptide repeat protein [Candidatus Cyclobacteriaceae bacterium M2_1C_046]